MPDMHKRTWESADESGDFNQSLWPFTSGDIKTSFGIMQIYANENVVNLHCITNNGYYDLEIDLKDKAVTRTSRSKEGVPLSAELDNSNQPNKNDIVSALPKELDKNMRKQIIEALV